MTIDQKVTVPGIFILANARLDERRIFESGNPSRQQLTHFGEPGARRYSIATVGIKGRSMTIDGYLSASVFEIGKAVRFVFEVDPNRQSGDRKLLPVKIGIKVENFLACGVNSIA